MSKRMLIDASHPEETRVVVLDGNKLDEFDFETSSKKQLKGNIYLAKVTRVEPSLQSAFVEYGGNRHGFLAFSEIHPDYYRIPIADREALLEEESRAAAEAGKAARNAAAQGNAPDQDDPFGDPRDEDDSDRRSNRRGSQNGDSEEDDDENIETVGGDDIDEAAQTGPVRPKRNYKIQEVIKRRQILLVQVTKEERGNKGAALTTYLSLAGRYCVLMPNTPRGGGISRKIVSPKDRKRLKAILDDLMIPEGMAVILRTAGLERTKAEIKRDLDYLLRLWDNIRETTLQSTAPALIYEEANLIKRAERDLYTKDIDDIQVAGEEGYRTAKDFMKMLMPSHARRVKPYRDGHIPLFQRYAVESQIDAMHSPSVQLKSGGYVVINPTEALVAIDVNSGRSTRERNIEETAYKTNLEAADEIARQLRLRDLAGLIVIDFIDMEDDRHNVAVERRLKDAMRQDRARIQLGRISAFGLLELSRQRLRPSLTETHFEPCPRCNGTGLTRSLSSAALHLLRAIEEEGIRSRSSVVRVSAATDVVLFVLNDKRAALTEIEQRYAFSVILSRDDSLIPPEHRIDQIQARSAEEIAHAEARAAAAAAEQRLLEKQADQADDDLPEDDLDDEDSTTTSAAEAETETARGDDGRGEDGRGEDGRDEDDSAGEGRSRRKRRSRSRRRRRDDRPDSKSDGTDGSENADDGSQKSDGDEAPAPIPAQTPAPIKEGPPLAAVATTADSAPDADTPTPAPTERQRPAGGWWARRRAAAEANSGAAVARSDAPALGSNDERVDIISTLGDAALGSSTDESATDDDIGEVFPSSSGAYDNETEEERQRRRRRRGKRGGRRRSGRRREEDGLDDDEFDTGPESGNGSVERPPIAASADGDTASSAGRPEPAPIAEGPEIPAAADTVAAASAAAQSDLADQPLPDAVAPVPDGDDGPSAQPAEAAAEDAKPTKRRATTRKRTAASAAEGGEKTPTRSRKRKTTTQVVDAAADTSAEASATETNTTGANATDTSATGGDADSEKAEVKPKRKRAPRKSTKTETAAASEAMPATGTAETGSDDAAPDDTGPAKSPAKKATTAKKAAPRAKTAAKTGTASTAKRATTARKKAEPKPKAAEASGADSTAGDRNESAPPADKATATGSDSPSPQADPTTQAGGDEVKKPRRGWWAARG